MGGLTVSTPFRAIAAYRLGPHARRVPTPADGAEPRALRATIPCASEPEPFLAGCVRSFLNGPRIPVLGSKQQRPAGARRPAGGRAGRRTALLQIA